MSKNTRARILLVAVAALLLVTLTVGGTMAWLQAYTNEVKNTFTPSTLSISIDETVPNEQKAQMVPGDTIEKDPDVTYTTDVPAYVFVKITKSNNYNTYLEDYVVADGWTAIETAKTNGVYNNEVVFYKSVTTGATDEAILNPESVKVKTTVTKDDMALLYTADGEIDETKCPTLSFQAYIIQSDNLVDSSNNAVTSAEDAWAIVSGT